MKVSDVQLSEVRERGYTLVPDFIDQQTLAAAQEALWEVFPRPEVYFADPAVRQQFSKSQFAGLRMFPYPVWALNRLAVYPDLVDAATRFCGTGDLDLYKVELWAKYAGATDYDQAHHRDYGNHTMVVPKVASSHVQMTTFILLRDVTELDGPTKIVPLDRSKDIPLARRELPMGTLFDQEITVTGKAGTLLIYKTDVLHRGSNFLGADRSRFVMLVDFQPRGWQWTGKMAWANHALSPHWGPTMVSMTPQERSLFGFPAPDSEYWDDQTVRDVGLRYPGMDMSAYEANA